MVEKTGKSSTNTPTLILCDPYDLNNIINWKFHGFVKFRNFQGVMLYDFEQNNVNLVVFWKK